LPPFNPSLSLQLLPEQAPNCIFSSLTMPRLFREDRSAMATGLAAAFAVALPVAAFADESADDIVKRIAAKSAVANEAARAKALDEEKKKEEGKDAGKLLVPAFLLGGVGLTLPFFLPNLIRLGKKTASLGEDDGYGNKKR
jgi:hypothetical protein